jgi:GMP synthase (glutamine-hydrolysing)
MLCRRYGWNLKRNCIDDKVVLGLFWRSRFYCSSGFITPGYENLYCIFCKQWFVFVKRVSKRLDQYKGMGLNVKGVDSGDRFLSDAGVSDPETKRKIIGRVFIEVLMMNRI